MHGGLCIDSFSILSGKGVINYSHVTELLFFTIAIIAQVQHFPRQSQFIVGLLSHRKECVEFFCFHFSDHGKETLIAAEIEILCLLPYRTL